MRKKYLLMVHLILLVSILVSANPTQASPPSYAKWGQLAVKTAKEKYPRANIVDYLHIGREDKPHSAIEKFKLWVDDQGKEFGLLIQIEFDPKNDRVIQVNTQKTNN